jgi:hypothetical protein
MRLKSDDYPAEHRDRARLVFFVPCGGGTALADLSIDHSRHALLTSCFLADHEVGQEWIVLREVRRGIEAALGNPDENPSAADAENEAAQALDPEVRAEIELVMTSAREQIVADGGQPTLGAVVRLAAKNRPDFPEATLQRVAVEILAAQSGPAGANARDAIHQEVARRLRIHPMVKQAMEESFAVVLDEFRNVTLKDSAVLESVGRQIHGVTGGQMRDFAQRLRDAVPGPLTEEQILVWADVHHEHTGKWPQVLSGAIEDTHGESDAHYRGISNWPNQNSGAIWDAPGETWAAVNNSLNMGLRGLSGGSSLAKLLAAQRGVRNFKGLPPLAKKQIVAWVQTHHERTGQCLLEIPAQLPMLPMKRGQPLMPPFGRERAVFRVTRNKVADCIGVLVAKCMRPMLWCFHISARYSWWVGLTDGT